MKAVAIFVVSLAQTAVLGKNVFPVPDPYRWDESFTVEYPRIDDEHRGLFNAILKIERENNEENVHEAVVKYRDHFIYEEGQFEQTMPAEWVQDHKIKHAGVMHKMENWAAPVPKSELEWNKNWLVQHIKNTDFDYMGLMPSYLPRPYIWDESFEVFYERLDDEHRQLFDCLREVGNHPLSTEALSDLKFKMRAHFDYEQGYFCTSETYKDCEEHKHKHDVFYDSLYDFKIPVPASKVYWASNWLAQHIKNTDFQYKFKLNTYEHTVPRPYVWEKGFEVYYPQLDEEHVGLFDAIRESVNHPESVENFDQLKTLMKEHFDYEEGEFKKIPNFGNYAEDHIKKHNNFMESLNQATVPLDCDYINFVETWFVQHVKNTDFAYRGKMIHKVPEPYVWEPSFMTFYKQIDDEHKVLFDCIRECGENPDSKEKYDNCKSLLRRHFDYEESEFCKVPDYDCFGHYLKHYNFQTKFQSAKLPLDREITDMAKNWLAQHIKNTDHAYRGKLYLRRHYIIPSPYIWEPSFSVGIKQMDDEHVGLFDIVRDMEANPGSQETWDKLVALYNEHFAHEEDLFTQIKDQEHDIADHRARHLGLMKTIAGAVVPITEEMTEFIKNWLGQHIKNTDFTYKGKMPEVFPVPDPYHWDASFAVMYPDMDNEHKPLFDCVEELKSRSDDAGLLASCLKSYEDHFAHEQSLFTKSATYPDEEAYQHINKHDAFLTTMRGLNTPVAKSWIAYATNWLVQHIKNTDFRYKGKMPFPVADPYVWDESFLVNYIRLDDEHVVLFDALQKLGENPDDVDLLNYNRDIFRDHFDYEQKQFLACGEECKGADHQKKHDVFFKTLTWVTNPVSKEYTDFAKNWLAQHIKNTDFLYKYKLPVHHDNPEPYIWNEDFAVLYDRLDSEHKVLFDDLRAVEIDPMSKSKIQKLKTDMRNHFVYEEKQVCNSKDIDWDYCKDHKRKHTKFSERLAKIKAPADKSEVKWAQDWLAQHIRNTDFGYKGKLAHAVPEPYVWNESFATEYSQIDAEHDVLFQKTLAISQHPENAEKLAELKRLFKEHFDYEEKKFCEIPNFACVDHKMKHYKFWVVFEQLEVPVGCEVLNWTKQWFAQHIKNTDHVYKGRFISD